jgi:hypothetical protein
MLSYSLHCKLRDAIGLEMKDDWSALWLCTLGGADAVKGADAVTFQRSR